jgi:hypothetical protein
MKLHVVCDERHEGIEVASVERRASSLEGLDIASRELGRARRAGWLARLSCPLRNITPAGRSIAAHE